MTQNPDHLNKVLAASLTAEDTALLPFLPYLLQDIWELGGGGDEIAALLAKHRPKANASTPMTALDLACGKGAVSIRVAKALGWRVKGVDLIPEFVAEAQRKAEEHGVAPLCTFEAGDANAAAQAERDYDCVIFAAAGNVLGDPPEMLEKLAATVGPGGLVVLDESYLPDAGAAEMQYQNYEMLTLAQWRAAFAKAGLRELDRIEAAEGALEEKDDSDLAHIAKRVAELSALHPEKKALLEGYLASQQAEVYDLENSLVNVGWLLEKQ